MGVINRPGCHPLVSMTLLRLYGLPSHTRASRSCTSIVYSPWSPRSEDLFPGAVGYNNNARH